MKRSRNRIPRGWDKIWLTTGVALSLSLLAMAAPRQAEHPRILASPQSHVGESHRDTAPGDQQSLRNIEDIKVGQTVLARDPATGELAPREVAHVIRRLSDHLRIIEIRAADDATSQTIQTTDEHPFWVAGKGWTKAGTLRPGDQLEQSDGGAAEVTSTRYELHPEGIPVYNIEVIDFHTYYVTAHGARAPPIWVHNKQLKDALRRFAKEEIGAVGDVKSLRKHRKTPDGGLNLWKDKSAQALKAGGWREGDHFLTFPKQATTKLDWKTNASLLRKAMRDGQPIFDTYVDPKTRKLIDTDGFLRAERELLRSKGWQFKSDTGAWHPPSRR